MQKIELEDSYIYRPSKGKKVKFANERETYSEIVVKKDNNKKVEEVD